MTNEEFGRKVRELVEREGVTAAFLSGLACWIENQLRFAWSRGDTFLRGLADIVEEMEELEEGDD